MAFSSAVMKIWNQWEMRVLVMVSLKLQIILSLFSTRRNRSVSTFVNIVLWLSYLSADYVATFALGILARGEGDDESKNIANRYLLSLWAPFFLLHLGGPDAITAFSMEDNQLWHRHGFSLIVQVMVSAYVCVRSHPRQFLLINPIVLVFVTGTSKYLERTLALRRGSMDGLRRSLVSKPDPDPSPGYAIIMERYAAKLRSGQPAPINVNEEAKQHQLDQLQGQSSHTENPETPTSTTHDSTTLLCKANEFFPKFKGLFVDAIFSYKDRNTSRSFFIGISREHASEAFDVIAFELNFAYEVLYTKANVSRTALGYTIRGLSSLLTLVALFLFYLADKNENDFSPTDVYYTYALLVVAFFLELVGVSRLILSDWTIVKLNSRSFGAWKWLRKGIMRLHRLDKPRWSNSMGQYNLLIFWLKDRRWLSLIFKFMLNLFGLKHIWDNGYTKHISVTNELKQLIFGELKEKSIKAERQNDYKRFTNCRGEYTLQMEEYQTDLGWSIEPEFDESLLIWHIATELYYIASTKLTTQQLSLSPQLKKKLNMARVLANYLLYLLVRRPLMLSSIAVIGVKRYEDTCAELKAHFKEEKEVSGVTEACRRLLSVNTDLRPRTVKGDESKSVLWDGCILAKQLRLIEDMEKGADLICKVWVEMLCFAAIHCRGNYHADRLKEGGELITFVWFLMTHLGMGQSYRTELGTATARLVSVED